MPFQVPAPELCESYRYVVEAMDGRRYSFTGDTIAACRIAWRQAESSAYSFIPAVVSLEAKTADGWKEVEFKRTQEEIDSSGPPDTEAQRLRRVYGDITPGEKTRAGNVGLPLDDWKPDGVAPAVSAMRESLSAGRWGCKDVAAVSKDCRELGQFLSIYQSRAVTLTPKQVTYIVSALVSAGNMLQPLSEVTLPTPPAKPTGES